MRHYTTEEVADFLTQPETKSNIMGLAWNRGRSWSFNYHDCEDVYSEVMRRAIQHSVDHEGFHLHSAALSSYIHRMALNAIYSLGSSKKRRNCFSLEESGDDLERDFSSSLEYRGFGSEENASLQELQESIRRVSEDLNPTRRRIVLTLLRNPRTSYKELQKLFSPPLNIGTLKSHLFRIRRKMREELPEYVSNQRSRPSQ